MLASAPAFGCLDGGVEGAEKGGAGGLVERGRAAGGEAGLSHVARDLAAGQGVADVVVGPDAAVRGQSAGGAGEAAGGERDVGGDADVGGGDALGDPVVGDVGALVDHDHADEGQVGRAARAGAVGDDADGDAEAAGAAADVSVLEQSMKEEQEMGDWLGEHIPGFVHAYLGKQSAA